MNTEGGHYSTAVMGLQPMREHLQPPRLFKTYVVPEGRPHCQHCGNALRRVDEPEPHDVGYVRILPNGRSIRVCGEHA